MNRICHFPPQQLRQAEKERVTEEMAGSGSSYVPTYLADPLVSLQRQLERHAGVKEKLAEVQPVPRTRRILMVGAPEKEATSSIFRRRGGISRIQQALQAQKPSSLSALVVSSTDFCRVSEERKKKEKYRNRLRGRISRYISRTPRSRRAVGMGASRVDHTSN